MISNAFVYIIGNKLEWFNICRLIEVIFNLIFTRNINKCRTSLAENFKYRK